MAAWPGQTSRARGQIQTGVSRGGRGFYYEGRRVLLMDTPGTEVVWAGDGVLQFSRDVLEAVFSTMSERGKQMLQRLAPYASGELQESCYCVVDAEAGSGRLLLVIGAEAAHALFQELGTSRHGATPFIRPTFDYLASQVPMMLRAESAARGGGR